jgi:tripartite ATP-independent transporter DctP family solute receptor
MKTWQRIVLGTMCFGIITIGMSGVGIAKTLKWKMASCLNSENLFTLHAKDWAERVDKKSDGRIKITVFDSEKLGSERETLEQMKVHALQCGIQSNSSLTMFGKTQNIYNLPYLFTSLDQCVAFSHTPEAKMLSDMFEKESGIKIIGLFPEGFRHIMNSTRPIETPEDLKGMKIRVMENPTHIASMNAMGATGTPISWGEVITSIQTKVIDGFENSIPTLASVKAWEFQDYLSLTTAFYDASFVVMDMAAWNSLSPEDQKIVMEASDEATENSIRLIKEYTKNDLETIKSKGVKVSTPDLQPFKDLVKPVYENFYKEFPELKPVVEKALSLQ